MKKISSLFLAIVLMLGILALTTLAEENIYVFEDEDIITEGVFRFKLVNQEAHLYEYCGDEIYVEVPNEVEGYPVTMICENAFSKRDNLQEVFISDGIIKIEDRAFDKCSNLKTVTFPSTLTESVKSVFDSCPSVNKIVINEGMTRVPDAFLESFRQEFGVILPETVEEIGYRAFNDSGITKINLEKVKRINGGGFKDCLYLKVADLRNVEYLGIHAFWNSGIGSINLQNIKEWIGAEYIDIKGDGKVSVWGQWHHGVHYAYDALCHTPFRKCNNLKTVRINYPETEEGLYHNLLISECPNIETVIIENFPKNFNKWDFSYDVEDKNPPNTNNPVNVPNATAQYGKMPPNMTIYGRGDDVKAYAESIGVPFKLLIDVNINGERIWMDDCLPYIKNNRTMVPMRAIFEALGAEVSWDDATKTAIGVKDGIEVKITIGENVLYKNGEAIELDAPAEITNDRTMVPVRAISEAFGCTVEWNNETKTVEITN